jgi:hypothetical protein
MRSRIFCLVVCLGAGFPVFATNTGFETMPGWKSPEGFRLFGEPISGVLRPYLGLGVTVAGLEDPQSRLNLHGGMQALFASGAEWLFFAYGLDAGFLHFGNEGNGSGRNALHLLAVGEMTVPGFQMQLGAGSWFGLGDRRGTWFGMMASGGIVIPLSDTLRLPLLIRADFVFAERMLVPLSFVSGLSWYLP